MKCQVQSLASIGGGCPDLLVQIAGRNVLVEVKTSKGVLTPDQETWGDDWNWTDYAVVHDIGEAVALVTSRRREI
jgi:hypothetical protein